MCTLQPWYGYAWGRIAGMIDKAKEDRSVTGCELWSPASDRVWCARHSSSTWLPHPRFPLHYSSFIVDPLLVPCLHGSVICFISCMKMCCISAIDFCPKCDELKYSWKWKEDVCRACECVVLQMLASSSYGISALLPWVVSEYIRIAKYEKKLLILSFIKCWSHVLIAGCVAESCWLTLADLVFLVKQQRCLFQRGVLRFGPLLSQWLNSIGSSKTTKVILSLESSHEINDLVSLLFDVEG